MFKYPVGAEVRFRRQCNFGETHLVEGVILSSFHATFASGEENYYSIMYDRKPNAPIPEIEIVIEMMILGRVNVRAKKNGDES